MKQCSCAHARGIPDKYKQAHVRPSNHGCVLVCAPAHACTHLCLFTCTHARARVCVCCCPCVSYSHTQVEDLSDENTVLRRKAGVSESDKVDTKDVRMQKDATIAQLRSLNALLERQVRGQCVCLTHTHTHTQSGSRSALLCVCHLSGR